ncbi:MAG: glycosyltransferase [Gammaproteobacteria bacterium]|nr:glycosyltransferase [Gammaproteobacteria bacterium]
MKILHLIDSGGFYGAESVLIELAKEQRKQGFDAQICSIGTKYDNEKAIETICHSEKIPVNIFRMRAGPNILGAFEILSFAKKEKFDILHSHGYKANILFGLMPEFIRQIPFIVTLHGWTSVTSWTKMWLYEKLDAFLLRFRKKIVLVSQAMLFHPNLQSVKSKCIVIENGISPEVPRITKDAIEQKITSLKQSGKKIVGSIGRLSYEKGYDTLIQAFSQCDKMLVLVIIGDGPMKDELRIIANKKGVGERVHFLGYVSQADQYLSLFDVYVNSSRTEGTPITLLEAMRASISIVARDVGGNRLLLGDGVLGELVEDELPASMARAITDSISTSHDKVDRAFKSFIENHTVAVMANKYSAAYHSLVSMQYQL